MNGEQEEIVSLKCKHTRAHLFWRRFLVKESFREFLIWFIVLFFLLIGYGFFTDKWWSFSISTVLIVGSVVFFERSEYKTRLGLKGPLYIWLLCTLFFPLCNFITQHIMTHVLPIDFRFKSESSHYREYLRVFFQCLNEEMVFRGLLLTTPLLTGSKWIKIIFISFFFAVGHWLFYRFNILPSNQGDLSLTAILTLFMFSVACNVFCLKFKTIAISLFFHYVWNVNRFLEILEKKGTRVLEYETFNLIEGSIPVFISVSLLLLFSLFLNWIGNFLKGYFFKYQIFSK